MANGEKVRPGLMSPGDGVLIGIILRCEEEYGAGCCQACFSLDGSHIGPMATLIWFSFAVVVVSYSKQEKFVQMMLESWTLLEIPL